MRGRYKRLSAGTIAMTVFAAIVLLCAVGMILTMRNPSDDLSMDAERLVSSIAELAAAARPEGTILPTAGEPTQNVQQSPIAAQTAQPTALPTPQLLQSTASQDVRTITLTISGGISFDDAVVSGTRDAQSGEYCLSETLTALHDQLDGDANIALLHNITDPNVANGNGTLLTMQGLREAGFDQVWLHSENAGKYGTQALAQAEAAAQSADMGAAGFSQIYAAQQAYKLTINDVSIALLSYADMTSSDIQKARAQQNDTDIQLAAFDAQLAAADIQAARADGADIVLVLMHWGEKTDTAPSSAQRTVAQALCDAGADIIIGAHSNAVQPVEYIPSASDAQHTALVAWSMGTLLSESRDSRAVVSGMLLHLTLAYDVQQKALAFSSVQYTPTYCWGQKDTIYKYRVLCSTQDAPENMIQKQREIMGRALKLIQETMAKGVATQR